VTTRVVQGAAVLLAGGIAALAVSARGCATGSQLPTRTIAAGSAIVTIHLAFDANGVIATSGGWAYCQQVRSLARRFRYTLVCGGYAKDGYTQRGLRRLRHLDWGSAMYLDSLARVIREVHRETGGPLVLLGVSYSGFGVATLASHHPELRPDRLIVIDSYMDLAARRGHSPDGSLTATEIDGETGGSEDELRRRSVRVEGLTRLVTNGTELIPIWTTSDHERRLFRGATCDRTASAGTIAEVAHRLQRPVPVWITNTKHGHNLWDRGREIMRGNYPGRKIVFPRSGDIPPGAVC
jgi:pimeloyl-ACP methyl ester carboxylesterase